MVDCLESRHVATNSVRAPLQNISDRANELYKKSFDRVRSHGLSCSCSASVVSVNSSDQALGGGRFGTALQRTLVVTRLADFVVLVLLGLIVRCERTDFRCFAFVVLLGTLESSSEVFASLSELSECTSAYAVDHIWASPMLSPMLGFGRSYFEF